MEAISEIGLTPVQVEQINACRMFLQITTLAEMSDHTGCNILPHVLLQPHQSEPTGLEPVSRSTLSWPAIHSPTKPTWKLWTKTICTLFTGYATGTKLRLPLGPWTTDYETHRYWKWRLTTDNRLLNQNTPTANTRAAILVKNQCSYMTFSLPIPTNQAFQGTPVTPHDIHNRMIRLPITSPPTMLPTVPTDAIPSLVAQFRAQLSNWQKPLYGPIRKH